MMSSSTETGRATVAVVGLGSHGAVVLERFL